MQCPSLALFATLFALALAGPAVAQSQPQVPQYQVDPFWPKPLPSRWEIGQASGVATDARDHVWVIHRPRSLTEDERGAALIPPRADCCIPAPAVLEFDSEGNLVQAWGGPRYHPAWPENEHGIYVDHQDNVWVAGNGTNDHVLLKFTRDGRFLQQIGRHRETGGSNDTERLGRPADVEVDPETNEVYVADGYGNRRVIVFDIATGAYRRHWCAPGGWATAGLPAWAAAGAKLPQSTLCAPGARRAALCLRPRQQPHPGFP
jgi:hypothetical protein